MNAVLMAMETDSSSKWDHHSPGESETSDEVPMTFDQLASGWNGYPQGKFVVSLSWREFRSLNDLKVDWAYNSCGVKQGKRGSLDAADPSLGKRSTRSCLGVLQCDNRDCQLLIRPKSKGTQRREQEGELCECNEQDGETGNLLTDYRLVLFPCPNVTTIVKWKDGVVYQNGVSHNHQPFEHKKRLSPREHQQTEELIKANPTATPAALRSGNTVTGESLLNICPGQFNTEDVVRNEVKKIRGPKSSSADDFVAQFAAFQQEYPDFVIAATFLNGITVISCQTDWMAEQLARANTQVKGFSGTVTDAAHGWFAVSTSLLITTSVFSPTMQRWIPGVYSFSNGGTAIHYEYHFMAVMRSVRITKVKLGLGPIVDGDFDGVSRL